MKSLIVYYSYSGNTRVVAEILAQELRKKGEADLLELKPLDESSSFLGQCRRAFYRQRAKLEPLNFDLSAYDLICFGTPVWAFAPAPAMNTYLDDCAGIKGKEVIIFTTYGSGAGKERCANYMQDILAKKGVKNFKRFSVQQFKVKNKESVLLEINRVAEVFPPNYSRAGGIPRCMI